MLMHISYVSYVIVTSF